MLLLSSADFKKNLSECVKHFRSRSGPMFCRSRSGFSYQQMTKVAASKERVCYQLRVFWMRFNEAFSMSCSTIFSLEKNLFGHFILGHAKKLMYMYIHPLTESFINYE